MFDRRLTAEAIAHVAPIPDAPDAPTRGARARSPWRRLATVVLASLGIVLAFATLTLAWATTPEGRNVVAGWVLEELSGDIEGSVNVALVRDVGIEDGMVRVEGTGVRCLDEHDEPVITVRDATVFVDLAALTDGDIVIARAIAEGGRVRVIERGNGDVGIDMAFRGTSSDGGGDRSGGRDGSGGGGGPSVTFEDVDARDVTVEIRPHGGPHAVLSHVHGHVAAHAGPEGAATLRFWAARGDGHLESPISIDARIVRADGSFDGDARTRLRAWVSGQIAGERLDARLALREEGDGVTMHVDTDSHGPLGFLLGLGIDLVDG